LHFFCVSVQVINSNVKTKLLLECLSKKHQQLQKFALLFQHFPSKYLNTKSKRDKVGKGKYLTSNIIKQ